MCKFVGQEKSWTCNAIFVNKKKGGGVGFIPSRCIVDFRTCTHFAISFEDRSHIGEEVLYNDIVMDKDRCSMFQSSSIVHQPLPEPLILGRESEVLQRLTLVALDRVNITRRRQ